MPYTRMQSLLDPLWARGAHNYFRSAYVDELDRRGDRRRSSARHRAVPSPHSEIHLHHFGGAVARVGATHGGVRRPVGAVRAQRDRPHARRGGLRRQRRVGARHAPRRWPRSAATGAYVNFMGDAGDDRLRASYGDAKYERLVALKRRYDPANLFRLNQNIRP